MKVKRTAKLLLVLLILAMVMPPISRPAIASSVGEYNSYKYIYPGKVKENLNLRTYPGTSYRRIKLMAAKSSVEVYGYRMLGKEKWYYLKHGTDKGYASSDYITLDSTNRRLKSSSSSTKKSSNYSDYVSMTPRDAVANRNVSLRFFAGTNYKWKKLINKGDSVVIYGYRTVDGKKWYYLKYGSEKGYAYGDYFNVGKIHTTPYKRITIRYAKATDTVNIRKGPSTAYSKVGSISKGRSGVAYGYRIHGRSKWYYVQHQGTRGYVSAQYINLESVYLSDYKKESARFAKNSENLSLRVSPSPNGKSISTIPKWSMVQTFGYRKRSRTIWRYVKSADSTGYVRDSYLNIDKTVSGDTYGIFTDYDPDLKGYLRYGVYLRKHPSSQSKKKELVGKGKTIKLRGYKKYSDGIWYLASSGKYNGFVKSTNVNLAKSSGDNISNYYKLYPAKEGFLKKRGNVRKNASTGSTKKGSIASGTKVKVAGYRYNRRNKWYWVEGGGFSGYVHRSNLTVTNRKYSTIPTTEAGYRNYLHDLGFPKSYTYKLWKLHQKKPKWRFKPVKVGYSWSSMLEKQSRPGNNLIREKDVKSWLSYEKGAFNVQKDRHYIFDGDWYPASRWLIAYYVDPRNFLNEEDIFQFLSHRFNSTYQTRSLVARGFGDGFLNSKSIDYKNIIYDAGKASGVNPNVIVAMIIMEQGWQGTSPLISGTYPGYEGLYNYFNIGAYTDSNFNNKFKRGLWYAGGQKNSKGQITSRKFNRPWTTRKKSIQGGAEFYKQGYIDNRQYNYYFKKFNNNNGLSKVATHEYMTNVQGAVGEGRLLAKALKDVNTYYTFYIPVYNNMPAKASPQPSRQGSNDNLLKSLQLEGYSLRSDSAPYSKIGFSVHQQSYSINIGKGKEKIQIKAVPHDSKATVYNAGSVNVKGKNSITVKVKSTSGRWRNYKIKLNWK